MWEDEKKKVFFLVRMGYIYIYTHTLKHMNNYHVFVLLMLKIKWSTNQ